MAYFAHPINLPLADIHKGPRNLLGCVDYVRNVGILGGEPFVHKDLAKIVETVCRHPKVATGTIITNGTILPSDELCEQLASNDNLLIIVSDYEALSRKRDQLIQKLLKHKIPYTLQRQMTWYEHGLFVDPYSRNTDEAREVYRVCNRNCSSLAGTLFAKCQIAIAFKLLKAIPPEFDAREKSVVDLSDNLNKDDIARYLASDEPIGACYVCSGKSRTHCKQIPSAIQTEEKLPYRRYDSN